MTKHRLSTFFILIAAVSFILLGILAILFPLVLAVRIFLINFMLKHFLSVFFFGVVLLTAGLGIAWRAIRTMGHCNYDIKAGKHLISVDKKAIKSYLDSYWTELFPQHEISNEVFLKKNKIHVSAYLPSYPLTEQKVLVEKIERELSILFNQTLGYDREFSLSITFIPK